MSTPCFLTLIGEPFHAHFHKNILKTFEDFDYCSPINYDDIDRVLGKMVEKAVTSKAVAILSITGHGNNNKKPVFTFPESKIEAEYIYNYLNHNKKKYIDFRCVILLEVCYSGLFAKIGDELCCDALITSTDDNHVSRNNTLMGAFNEILGKYETFTPNQIYSYSHKDNKESLTVQINDAWDFSYFNDEIAKKNKLSKDAFEDCIPQKFGDTELQLKPVISSFIMTEVVKNTEAKKEIFSGGNLHKNLLEYTKENYTLEEFFSSMTLRQFKYNCIVKPINTTISK